LARATFETKVRPISKPQLVQIYEFIEGGHDLESLLDSRKNPKGITWAQRLIMAKVFLASMKGIHKSGVVHCDLKPANVQMVPVPGSGIGFKPLIIDMDNAILSGKKGPWHGKSGYVGTANYQSPEHLAGGDVFPLPESDVFTAALIIYELLGQGNPYASESPDEYKEKIFSGSSPEIRFQGPITPQAESVRFSELLRRALSPRVSVRPTMEELHKGLLPLNPGLTESIPPPPPSREPPSPHKTTPPLATEQIVLKGENGELNFGISAKVGNILLKKISSQSNYAADPQFELIRRAGTWTVVPILTAPNPTLLNDKILQNETILKNGDILCLGGRKNPAARVLKLTVHL
jgi:serine/threonine protein kinase